MLRLLIVEDERVIGDRLARLARKILGERVGTITWTATLPEALEHVETEPVDILFLDLDLHGKDGFELLHQAVAGSFHTIVVSARHEQALRAFEYGVADFVPKPFDEERLRVALARTTEREPTLRAKLRHLAVRRSGAIVPVAVTDLLFVKGAGDYSELHLRDGTRHLHDKTLTLLEQLLPERFRRVHRSYIADTEAIESYRSEPGSRYFACLVGGLEIPVGRDRIKGLRQLLL